MRCSEDDLGVLRILPRLPRLQATAWSRAARLSRFKPAPVTQRTLGMAAGAVVQDYRVATVEWLKNHGHALSAIAAVADYSSKQAISRALLSRRR